MGNHIAIPKMLLSAKSVTKLNIEQNRFDNRFYRKNPFTQFINFTSFKTNKKSVFNNKFNALTQRYA